MTAEGLARPNSGKDQNDYETKNASATVSETKICIDCNQMRGKTEFNPILGIGGLTTRHATKMAAATHAATDFSFGIKEMSSVAAFTPFFNVWLTSSPANSVLKYPDSVGKTAIPSDSVGYRLNILNEFDRKTESPPIFECGYNRL